MTLHPLDDLVRPGNEPAGGHGADGPGPDGFARAIEAVVDRYDWERLRRVGLTGPDREVAAWMDEGCFARWTLGRNPEVPDLLAALRSLLPPEAVAPVATALDRWGIVA
jgi:hypothetical protein